MSRYIDADHLIERATNPYGDSWASTGESTSDFVDYINEEPTAEVKPIVYGEWILADKQSKEDTENDNYRFICSKCQCSDIHAKGMKVPYCWSCGTTMKKESEEEE